MSLDFNYSKCDPTCKAPEHWPITESLIFASMGIGLGVLNAKNVKEWRVRIGMWAETVDGESYRPLRDLPMREWERRYGLWTNVSPETRAHLRNRVARMIENSAERAIKSADRKVVEAGREVSPS